MDIDDINAIIDEAEPAELSIAICLRANLVAEYEELEQQRADAATRVSAGSLAGDGGDARVIAEQMEALREQMKAATVPFRVRALPRKEFKKLLRMHPPRRDDDGKVHGDDQRLDVNNETVWDPLIRACLVGPKLDPARLTHVLDEVLSNRQFEELAYKAWQVNNSEVDIPFSSAAFVALRDSSGE